MARANAESLRRTCAQVTAELWIGGELAPLPDQVVVVITLEATAAPLTLAGVTEHRFPFRDTRWEQAPRLVVAAAVELVVGADEPVLVRCRHGLNRSALVACLALRCGNVAAEEAVRLIRLVRPGALSNLYFNDLVHHWPDDPMTVRTTPPDK